MNSKSSGKLEKSYLSCADTRALLFIDRYCLNFDLFEAISNFRACCTVFLYYTPVLMC
jgi:hypothetical protein